jgi:lipoprotein-anchoring transpeptidase ErfK/SrfK
MKKRVLLALCVCAVAMGAALLAIAQEQIATAADLMQSDAEFDAARLLTFDPAATLNGEDLFGIDESDVYADSAAAAMDDSLSVADAVSLQSDAISLPQDSILSLPKDVMPAPVALPGSAPADSQDAAAGWPYTTAETKLAGRVSNPPSSGHWVDVNLSRQQVTAYIGSTPIKTVWTSTGTRIHPTVVGTFRVWIKLRSTRMSGGSRARGDYYSLPNVPWVMYFYRGYALHGAYWHHNFGHVMSHGCVNLTIPDSAWFYNFGFVGMPVRSHY